MRVEGPRLVEAFIEFLPIYTLAMFVSSLPFVAWFVIIQGSSTTSLTPFSNPQGVLYFTTAILLLVYTWYGAFIKDFLKKKGVEISFKKVVKLRGTEYKLDDLTIIGTVIFLIVLGEYISIMERIGASELIFILVVIIMFYGAFLTGNYIRITQVLLFISWIFITGFSIDLIRIYKDITASGGDLQSTIFAWVAWLAPVLGMIIPRYRYLKEIVK